MLRVRGYRGLLTFVLVVFFAVGSVRAADFSFTGTFSQDDDVQLFTFVVGAPSTVTLKTYSYAGGTNAMGTVIPHGGFDPVLALFNGAGVRIGQNDDGSPPNVGVDPITGNAWDTFLQTSLGAGTYSVSVMQYDNLAIGPNLSNGFDRQGQGNFTGASHGPGSGSFYDASGAQRTNAWAFDVLNVQGAAAVAAIPEPSTYALMLAGLGIVGFVAKRRRKTEAVA